MTPDTRGLTAHDAAEELTEHAKFYSGAVRDACLLGAAALRQAPKTPDAAPGQCATCGERDGTHGDWCKRDPCCSSRAELASLQALVREWAEALWAFKPSDTAATSERLGRAESALIDTLRGGH